MVGSCDDTEALCDRFVRLLGCDSGLSGRVCVVVEEFDGEAEDCEARAAAAARAAWVTGICIPKLGSDSDLRRVL